jgi:methyl-accepting chemotaxis protein
MNLDDAIKAHAEWKLKLRSAIARKEKIDAATLGRDDCCPLGKWLHGEARSKFNALGSYKDCLSHHAGFHAAAGKVALLVNAQRYAEAEQQLGSGTAYATASGATAASIIRLKKDVALAA